MTGLLVACSLAHYLISATSASAKSSARADVPWLVLLPRTSWRYPWTLLSAGFVELNVIEVCRCENVVDSGPVLDLVGCSTICVSLPRAFVGPSRTAALHCCCHCWLQCDCLWVCLDRVHYSRHGNRHVSPLEPQSDDIRSGTAYHGLSGLQSGFLVAFTQIIPEHQIQLFGVIKVRVKVRMAPASS